MFSISPIVACAVDVPHAIIGDGTWLLNNEGAKIFLMPAGYYAKILSMDENYYYVIFNGVNGKISRSNTSVVGYNLIAKGTSEALCIDDEYFDFDSIFLKKNPITSSENVTLIPTTDGFIFLGEYPQDDKALWYYIKYNQFYGYIKSTRTNKSTITYDKFVPDGVNEAISPESNNAPIPDGNSKDKKTNFKENAVRAAIVIGLVIPTGFVVILIFRSGKTRKYYDE
jgi:hypothetical protein